MEIANCKFCNSEFEMRRSDQKFCSNKCRSRFNNKNRLRNNPIIKETNKTLLNDYIIFLGILGNDQEAYVEKQKLMILGFSGRQCTRLENLDKVKESVLVIYDIAFYRYDENYFKIIKL
jgi:predicted nucleic acid-binding Zn ribbon protein